MKPFLNHPAYISAESALEGGANPGFSMFPAPGQPSGNNDAEAQPNNSNSNPAQGVIPFAGNGVVLGTAIPSGYQGSANNNGGVSYQNNIREVPSGPNPLAQKSKLVQEHNEKNKGAEEAKESEELDNSNPDNTSQNSKNEDEELLDLS